MRRIFPVWIYRGILTFCLLSVAACGSQPAGTTAAEMTLSQSPSATSQPAAAELPPVKVDKTGFTVDGKPFRFIGANSPYFGFYKEYKFSIEDAIRTAKENGINVLRIYLGSGNGTWSGKPMEEYDRALDIAGRNGVYVIAVLTECCCYAGDWLQGKDGYFKMYPYCEITDPQAASSLKDTIKQILTRKNSVNGKIYKDDTTIMAWDVANEPYLQGFTPDELKAWLSDLTSYVKSIDPNHLVTLGLDASGSLYDSNGPHYQALDVPGLDFISFHFNQPDFNTALQRLDALQFRVKSFLAMRKPVLLEEFGVGSQRIFPPNTDEETLARWVEAYKYQFDAVFSAGASGAMFWGWGVADTRKIALWWRNEDHDASEKEFCDLIRNYSIPAVGTFDLADLPGSDPNDDFTGKVLDTSKWLASANGGAVISQDDRVILKTDGGQASSSAAVTSNWSLPGDFEVQIDYEIGEGWKAPAQDHLDGAAFGASIGGVNYHITRLRSAGEDVLFAWSSDGTLNGRLDVKATTGRYKIIRKDALLTFYYYEGSGWRGMAHTSVPKEAALVYFMNGSVNASTGFTTYFDNFKVNSGTTNYRTFGSALPVASVSLPGKESVPLSQMQSLYPWLPLDQTARPDVYYIYFNLTKPPFDNVLVRKAFTAAIDREAIVKIVAEFGIRNPTPATTFTPPETLGRDLYNAVGIPFDPVRARELLAQAGYADGASFPPAAFLIGVREEDPPGFHEKIAEAITAMWRDNLGVNISVDTVDFDTYQKRIASDPPEMFRAIRYPAANDPHEFMFIFYSQSKINYGHFANSGYDDLVASAAKADGAQKRQEIYIEAEKLVTEQQAVAIPVYHALYP